MITKVHGLLINIGRCCVVCERNRASNDNVMIMVLIKLIDNNTKLIDVT